MMAAEQKCSAADNKYFAQPCEGPLLECRGYGIDGSSLYRCEKHAKEGMQFNPFGPVFRPIKKKRGE